MHEHRYLVDYIPLQLQVAPAGILYPLVVLAALASLVVPHLGRRRYAGGLWTAVLLNPIIVLPVWFWLFITSFR
jgi:cytochrome c oxidase subunit IV